MSRKLWLFVFVPSVALWLSLNVQAQTTMKSSVMSAGATSATNGATVCRASFGQAIIGRSSVANTIIWQGFWQPLSAKTTGVYEEYMSGNAAGIHLSNNTPNPFSTSTRMEVSLPSRASVQMKVYNAVGQEVQTLLDGEREAGTIAITFDAVQLPTGSYTVVLMSGTSRVARVITKVD